MLSFSEMLAIIERHTEHGYGRSWVNVAGIRAELYYEKDMTDIEVQRTIYDMMDKNLLPQS